MGVYLKVVSLTLRSKGCRSYINHKEQERERRENLVIEPKIRNIERVHRGGMFRC